MNCVICKTSLTGFGNNALPYKMGKCCDFCNYTVVLPLRLNFVSERHNESIINKVYVKTTLKRVIIIFTNIIIKNQTSVYSVGSLLTV